MLFYYFIILALFFLHFVKSTKLQEALVFLFLCCFYCFAYKLGSDWQGYEDLYSNEFEFRAVEPGFMLVSSLFSSLNIDFWSYYYILKTISFVLTIIAVSYFMQHNNKYFAFMLYVASFVTYLYLDCPFRNTIAISIMFVGLIFLHKKKLWLFYVFCLLSMSFHLSATPLLLLPLCRFDKLSNKVLLIIYFTTLLVFLGGDQVIFRFLSFMPPIIQDKVLFYGESGSEASQILSPGLILRLGCLFLMLSKRETIIAKYDKGAFMFNLAYLYLLLSLASYTVSMLFRCGLFLGLFYVIYINYGIRAVRDKGLKAILYWFYFLAAVVITYTTLKKGVYEPYENAILNYII